ncbi:MAG: hypothetical protein ABI758_03665 [Candidatus Woesebacteria bacterium]
MRVFKRRIFVCVLVLVLLVPTRSYAQDTDPRYQEKLKEIENLKGKITQLQGEARTLSSAISYLTNKKTLTEKQVEATEFEISVLTRDITSLGGKIETLEGTLDEHTRALISDVQVGYKQGQIDPYQLVFSSHSFADLSTRARYIQLASVHHSQMLKKTTEVKISYDTQKQEKEVKQKQVETLKVKLQQQQADLVAQEQAKKQLLSDTKNSEGNYQKLLAQAEAELASFRAFTSSKGGGILPAQSSPDGWFYSQRDERWANMTIGNSGLTKNPDTILDVGCLVTSIAMVKKKYGDNVTPANVAQNGDSFYLNTGAMRRPWPAPSGYRFEVVDRKDLGLIDTELKEGRPVIVKLSVRTSVVGTHFIVLKSGQNGDYMINDPWEGYDKKFNSLYSTGQIIGVGYLRKN